MKAQCTQISSKGFSNQVLFLLTQPTEQQRSHLQLVDDLPYDQRRASAIWSSCAKVLTRKERPWQERTFDNVDSFDNFDNFDTFENLNYAKVWRGGGGEKKKRKATRLPRGEEEGGGTARFKLCGR